ncbi:MAG TPA: M48 family metalloprotease [Thermoanaerobaculia bacterium]|nr:M48 family metalloprotease [Thermoanaerobaculia bacterium]
MTIEILPNEDERKWLGRYLRKLIERQGWETFVLAPLLHPTPKHFPERWSRTVADVHRLTQHLLQHAGLGELSLHLSGFGGDRGGNIWDRGTAAWFAGIEDGRCVMGVHVSQLRDEEAAVGVMAHEVAHAWRAHHHLVSDDREREELLTDLTTVYLGFGVLTTNNTDRYRSSGDSRSTSWSVSSAGYLPPQSMAWLLALQALARGRKRELQEIAAALEPLQKQSFEAAIDAIDAEPSYLDALQLPPRETWPEPRAFAPAMSREPEADEVIEPPAAEANPQRNAGKTVYRVPRTSFGWILLVGAYPGALVGVVAGFFFFEYNIPAAMAVMTLGIAISVFITWRRTWRYICSDRTCTTTIDEDMPTCPGCGGNAGAKITVKRLAALREQELERWADEMDYEECAECEPERPCEKHRATTPFEEFVGE